LPKTYIVQTKFPVSTDDCDRLREGVILDDGTKTLPALVSYLDD
jgi:16S rRNA U516 pseudouridylate synthase RsuA-like enzyme